MKKNQRSNGSSGNGKWLSHTYIDTESPSDKRKPTGPFKNVDHEQEGDVLLFVPRSETGKLVNSLTGRHGYSHMAIDCGEIDEPSGRRVMIEATLPDGVHYGFQDEYGTRQFVRLSLRKAGVNVQEFCECVHARVGEKFDELEILSLGIIDNPAKQICSDLAADCLPEAVHKEIARRHRTAAIHPLAAGQDEMPGSRSRLFMSPNAFAEFLGAPRGSELEKSDQVAEPHIQESGKAGIFPKLWKRGDALMTTAWRKIWR